MGGGGAEGVVDVELEGILRAGRERDRAVGVAVERRVGAGVGDEHDPVDTEGRVVGGGGGGREQAGLEGLDAVGRLRVGLGSVTGAIARPRGAGLSLVAFHVPPLVRTWERRTESSIPRGGWGRQGAEEM